MKQHHSPSEVQKTRAENRHVSDTTEKPIRVRRKSILKQLTLLMGMSLGAMTGGSLSVGCNSFDHANTDHQNLGNPEKQIRTTKQKKAESSVEIKLTHDRAVHMAMTTRLGVDDNEWEMAYHNPYDEDSSSMSISYESGYASDISFDSDFRAYRATRYAELKRLLDLESDNDIPEFPISLQYHISTNSKRSWSPLANHDFVNSSRISFDNLFASLLYNIGDYNGLNDSLAYRSTALFLQAAQMLTTSRLGHEFAHAYDESVRDQSAVPLQNFLRTSSSNGENTNYENLISSQAAGLNNSSHMAIQYWRQAETRGNIVAALGFFIARNDALIQWVYGHLVNNGHPEQKKRRQRQKLSTQAGTKELKELDEFEEEFEKKEIVVQEQLDPDIFQVTGHGDSVAYIKLLETLGHGNAHRDKDLAILLATNAFSAYFWQSITELIQYVSQGQQTHERWRMIGPMEYPLFSTYRLPEGYLTQARLPFVINKSIFERLTLIGARDLDEILGGLNTTQLGAELSGNLPGELSMIRWSIGTLCTFDRHDWKYQGNIVQGSLSVDTGPVTFSISGSHQQNDPFSSRVELMNNGFSLQMGAEFSLGPWKKEKKHEPYFRPQETWPTPEPLPESLTYSDDPKNRESSSPAPLSSVILSKR